MLDATIKDFYNKTGVSVEITLSMSNPDAKLTMSLGDGLERYFYINNFLPTTDEEVMNLLTSILEQWIEDIKELFNINPGDVVENEQGSLTTDKNYQEFLSIAEMEEIIRIHFELALLF